MNKKMNVAKWMESVDLPYIVDTTTDIPYNTK